MKRKFLLISLITIYQLLIIAPPAHADFSLGIFPPIIEIKAKPPANISTPLLIENLSPEPVELNIELKPFIASDQENGQIKYLESIPQEYSSIFQRVAVLDGTRQINQLALGPKQKKELTLNINIPRDTIAQDYYFSIVFAHSAGSGQVSEGRSGTEILGGLATNVLLSIDDTVLASGVIAEFSSPIFIEKGPVPFTVRVKNTGSHFIAPKGEIIIRNLLGEEVGRVDLLPVNILAKSVRSIPGEAGDVEALWKENIIIGPYRATLNIVLSDNGPQFSREIIFFGFPGITILTIFGSLIVLLYLVSRIRKKV